MQAIPLFPMRVAALCLAVVFAAGCASVARRGNEIASAAGFTKEVVQGARFRHVTYASRGTAASPVWVYIEGDGIPWRNEFIPSADPTPHILIALEAMAAGRRPALYLGRPCYFDVNRDAGCEPLVWTHRRFAPEVIDSMVAALRVRLGNEGLDGRPLVLVGFSGGGTLATLMAHKLVQTCALITMASPLDIDEWAGERGYSPLDGSVDPAKLPPLPSRVRQLHLRGGRDGVVAAANGAAYFSKQPDAQLRVIDAADHAAIWISLWRDLAASPGALPDRECAR